MLLAIDFRSTVSPRLEIVPVYSRYIVDEKVLQGLQDYRSICLAFFVKLQICPNFALDLAVSDFVLIWVLLYYLGSNLCNEIDLIAWTQMFFRGFKIFDRLD